MIWALILVGICGSCAEMYVGGLIWMQENWVEVLIILILDL